MTAEIAILNRSAVAIAADSAATVVRYTGPTEKETRVHKGANKLFALSRREPVAVMIFGDASFMGVPWETLVKMYRADHVETTFNTLAEYARNFFTYLEKHPTLFPDDAQFAATHSQMLNYAVLVLHQAIEKAKNAQNKGKRILNRFVGEEIDEELRYVNKCKYMRGFAAKDTPTIIQKYEKELSTIITQVFQDYTISKPRLIKLRTILVAAISKVWFAEANSGIVFAGFGTAEHYPRLYAYRCQGLFENVLLRVQRESEEISNQTTAAILPFAQTEMVRTFFYGIDPDILNAVTAFLNAAFDELHRQIRGAAPAVAGGILAASKIIREKFDDGFMKYAYANHARPMYRIIDMLSKEEMAELAETLIIMESLKKRITQPVESVGGPVDVAVVSKAEGVIWIKRKHYFSPELNQDYFVRLGAK